MLDLFATPILPGFHSARDFLTPSDERNLIAEIDALDLTPFRFQQWTGKRLTHSFGWSYDFQTGALDQAEPLPSWLLPIRARAAESANLREAELAQALITRYDPDAGIGWHRDRPIYEHVVGISLGAPAKMRFRQRDGSRWRRATASLEPRGIYRLTGDARHRWEHSITPMVERRYSVTFRSFRDDD